MGAMPDQQWVFRARMTHVVDGDTIDVVIDQGMHAQRTERLRLLRVDTPEMRGETRQAGLVAQAFVERWITLGNAPSVGDWPLVVQTYKSDVFGRYLAEVWRVYDGHSLNDDLLLAGMAVPFDGGKA